MYMGSLFRNRRIGLEFNSSLTFLGLQLQCMLASRRPLSNFWRGEMAGEKTMTEIIHLYIWCVCLCVSLCRCHASQDSANLPKYIFIFGIHTTLSSKQKTIVIKSGQKNRSNYCDHIWTEEYHSLERQKSWKYLFQIIFFYDNSSSLILTIYCQRKKYASSRVTGVPFT